MNFLLNIGKGYGTYVTLAAAALTALGSYMTGTIDLSALIQALFAIITAVFLRRSIT